MRGGLFLRAARAFGIRAVTRDEFRAALLAQCRAAVGTRETARNSGPLIDKWLANVGQQPGLPWCVAWTYSMYQVASFEVGCDNPHPRTAGSLRLWSLSEHARTPLPAPGDVFVLEKGEGRGHVGIVESVEPGAAAGGLITTVEGNSNAAGHRDGDGVYRHTWAPRDGTRGRLLGFLDLIGQIAETENARGLRPGELSGP